MGDESATNEGQAASDAGLFAGIRILDFSQVLAGPTCTRLFVEMGADVIKIEPPPGGESSRRLPYLRDGRSGYFIQQNRGKRSLCVALKSTRGRALVEQLVSRSDVVVENFAPGVITRLGFGYAALKQLKPDIVMCSISAFGQHGPLSHLPGYDGIAQAYSGVMHMNGPPEGAPSLMLISPGDSAAGVYAATAVAAALFQRERTGLGQYIEVSLLDAYINMHEINVQTVSGSHGSIVPKRAGSVHPTVCPYGVLQANDGFVVIAVVTDDQWSALCRAIDRSDLAADDELATNAGRARNQTRVYEELEAWTAQRSTTSVRRTLEAVRVPVAPVLSVNQMMDHAHVLERNMVPEVSDPVWGTLRLPAVPFRFENTPDTGSLIAPALGEHNVEILRELGVDEIEVAAMYDEGVIFAEH